MIKEAFETLKNARGYGQKIDSNLSEDFQSSRPSSQQYSEDFSDFEKMWSRVDSRVFRGGLDESENSRLKESLENIEAVRDLRLNIADVNLKNTDARWNFDDKGKLRIFGSNSNLAFIGVGISVVLLSYTRSDH